MPTLTPSVPFSGSSCAGIHSRFRIILYWTILLRAPRPYNVKVAPAQVQGWHSSNRQFAWVLALVLIGIVALLSYQYFLGGPEPRVLTRETASRAIAATAEFQHKTTIAFELGREEAVFPGACHEFRFSPAHETAFQNALRTGVMQFSAWGDASRPIPFGWITNPGSFDLATGGMLVDNVGPCTKHDEVKGAGDYELIAGEGLMIEVSGLRPDGDKKIVAFRWYFSRLSAFAKALPRTENQTRYQRDDARITEH